MEENIAIYLRLSLEDVDLQTKKGKNESNSISTQRMLIMDYISQKPYLRNKKIFEFADDGYTGTNFERPQFQKLLEMTKQGNISCIIVKDLSRFGRDYLEVGDYLEHIFPFLGVRFIAINDNYDSDDYGGTTGGIEYALRNVLYQKNSQDLSVKMKSTIQMKMLKGKFVNHAPYGYQKSPDDKHRMILDPCTAPIVHEIFEFIIAGGTTSQMASILNKRNIPTPYVYKNWKNREEEVDRILRWDHRTVLRIIKDIKYTGTMTSHTRENKTIRAKTQKRVPSSEWIINEGTHEAIVSKEEYDLANASIRRVKSVARKKYDTSDRVFYCGYCGRKLIKTFGVDHYFSCETAVYNKGADCSKIKLKKSSIDTVILAAFIGQLKIMDTHIKQIKSNEVNPMQQNKEETRIRQVENELKLCDSKKLSHYEKYRLGELDKETFLDEKLKLMKKAKELEEELEDLKNKSDLQQQLLDEEKTVVESISAYVDMLEYPEEILKNQMYKSINHILVYDENNIEINWKFSDLFADL